MSLMNKGTIPPTVIISRIPDRSGNFVCDGTADNVEIVAAIAYLNALGGGKLFFKTGTYVIAVIMDSADYISYEGEEKDTTILQMADNANLSPMLRILGDDYNSVKTLTFDGNKANQTTNGRSILIRDITDCLL